MSQSRGESSSYRYIITVEYNNTSPLKVVMDCLPGLTSLDISGTDLAGFEAPEVTSHKLGPAKKITDSNETNNSEVQEK